jgi:hypothetical protein
MRFGQHEIRLAIPGKINSARKSISLTISNRKTLNLIRLDKLPKHYQCSKAH